LTFHEIIAGSQKVVKTHNFKQHKKQALKHHVSALVLCLDVIKEIPFFILEVGENPLNV
jgi:uncharacterized protein with WD repeat